MREAKAKAYAEVQGYAEAQACSEVQPYPHTGTLLSMPPAASSM